MLQYLLEIAKHHADEQHAIRASKLEVAIYNSTNNNSTAGVSHLRPSKCDTVTADYDRKSILASIQAFANAVDAYYGWCYGTANTYIKQHNNGRPRRELTTFELHDTFRWCYANWKIVYNHVRPQPNDEQLASGRYIV